jgi:hypothetical protein
LVNSQTNKIFTDTEWAEWIDELHLKKLGEQITDEEMNLRIGEIKQVIAEIPTEVIEEIEKVKLVETKSGTRL